MEPKPLDATTELSVRMMTLKNALAEACKGDLALKIRLTPILMRIDETTAHIEDVWRLLSRGIYEQKQKVEAVQQVNAQQFSVIAALLRSAGGSIDLDESCWGEIASGSYWEMKPKSDKVVTVTLTEPLDTNQGVVQ